MLKAKIGYAKYLLIYIFFNIWCTPTYADVKVVVPTRPIMVDAPLRVESILTNNIVDDTWGGPRALKIKNRLHTTHGVYDVSDSKKPSFLSDSGVGSYLKPGYGSAGYLPTFFVNDSVFYSVRTLRDPTDNQMYYRLAKELLDSEGSVKINAYWDERVPVEDTTLISSLRASLNDTYGYIQAEENKVFYATHNFLTVFSDVDDEVKLVQELDLSPFISNIQDMVIVNKILYVVGDTKIISVDTSAKYLNVISSYTFSQNPVSVSGLTNKGGYLTMSINGYDLYEFNVGPSRQSEVIPLIFKIKGNGVLQKVIQSSTDLTDVFGDLKEYIFTSIIKTSHGDKYHIYKADITDPSSPKSIIGFYEPYNSTEKYRLLDDGLVYGLAEYGSKVVLTIAKVGSVTTKVSPPDNGIYESGNLLRVDSSFKVTTNKYHTDHSLITLSDDGSVVSRIVLSESGYVDRTYPGGIAKERYLYAQMGSRGVNSIRLWDVFTDTPVNKGQVFFAKVGIPNTSYAKDSFYPEFTTKDGYVYGIHVENVGENDLQRAIKIFRVDDPFNPVEVSSYSFPLRNKNQGFVSKSIVNKNTLYFLDFATKELYIFEIKVDKQLVLKSQITVDDFATEKPFSVKGNYLYFKANNSSFFGRDYMKIIDISDPSTPHFIESKFDGSYIYSNNNIVLTADDLLSKQTVYTIYDASNINSPIVVDSFITPLQSFFLDEKIYSPDSMSRLRFNAGIDTPYMITDISKYFTDSTNNSYEINKIAITDENSNEYALDKVPENTPLILVAETNINTLEDINFKWSIDGVVIKEGLGTDNSFLDYTFINHSTVVSVSIQRGSEGIVSKEVTITLEGEVLTYEVKNIVVSDSASNEYPAGEIPSNIPLILVAETNINTLNDINFKWFIDDTLVKEGLGDNNSFLDHTFNGTEKIVKVTIQRNSETIVSKEIAVTAQLTILSDIRAIGEDRSINISNGYFKQDVDGLGSYYVPTSNKLTIVDTKKNEVITHIELKDPSKVKIYDDRIVGYDDAYITFSNKQLPLFEGKFIIEDGVLRNSLLAETVLDKTVLDKNVLRKTNYCNNLTQHESNEKRKACYDLYDWPETYLTKLVSTLSLSTIPATDAILLVGIDARGIGLSPALMATPYVWDAKLDLSKKSFKLTALASTASSFNIIGKDFSLLDGYVAGNPKKGLSLLGVAKKLGAIPFVYSLKADGSATTAFGKSTLNIGSLNLEFSDSKSLVLESKVKTTSTGVTYRTNKALIKKAKAFVSIGKNKSNIAFNINNAKLVDKNGRYELVSYNGGASFTLPEISLGKGRSIKNASFGIYFVGRSSLNDTDDWPVAFTDKYADGSKFYMYLEGRGEYQKIDAPNDEDLLISIGNDYKNTLTVAFKVIPASVSHYDNFLMLSADIGYHADGSSSIVSMKGMKLDRVTGAYRYDPALDDFLWRVGAGVKVSKYQGYGSLYWNWGDNLALGASLQNFGYTISNNKRYIFGDTCMLGGKLTQTFMDLAECPKLTNSCSANSMLSPNSLVSNGFIFGLKANPYYESRYSAAYDWEKSFEGVVSLELTSRVLFDERVKKGDSNAYLFEEQEKAYLSGSGALSLNIPKSQSKYFPIPSEAVELVNFCAGMSPLDIKHYYKEGIISSVEKVENIKGLYGLYGKTNSILSNKELSVFYSFLPFQLIDEDEARDILVGTNFTIQVKDTVTKSKLSKRLSANFKEVTASRKIVGEKVIETLLIPENDSGPIVVVKGVNLVKVTSPSGLVNPDYMDSFDFIDMNIANDSVTIGLNNPEPGEWIFEFENKSNNEFIVLTENKPPVATARSLNSSLDFGATASIQLDYTDEDSNSGFVRIVATDSNGEESVLFDESVNAAYSEVVELILPKPDDYSLSLFYTDGLRGYIEEPIGSITVNMPSKLLENLQVVSDNSSVVAEWDAISPIKNFEVSLINRTTSITNKYDLLSHRFDKGQLVDGSYVLKLNALYDGAIVGTLSKEFVINSEGTCDAVGEVNIEHDFTNGYFLDFKTTGAKYYNIDIKSLTDRFKILSEKQIVDKINISSLVGESVAINVKATNECGDISSDSLSIFVSNRQDSDSDGLFDDWENRYFGNLEQLASGDYDSDGVSNIDELSVFTHPDRSDTDGDKVTDKDDANPLSYFDDNSNTIPDDWEAYYQITDISSDPDNDGVSSYDEFFLGTNPNIFEKGLEPLKSGRPPVILTDKDNHRVFTSLVGLTSYIDATKTFDPNGDSFTYQWFLNGNFLVSTGILSQELDKVGFNFIKLVTKDSKGLKSSRDWIIYVTKTASKYDKYIKTGAREEVMYFGGSQFTIPSSVGVGSLLSTQISSNDLPKLPKGYFLVGSSGALIMHDSRAELKAPMSISHVSDDIVMVYSFKSHEWVEVAGKGKSVETQQLGIFALVTKESTTVPVVSKSNSGGGCFIATAAFGSYLQSDVQVLRDFRDDYLLTNTLGSMFVESYYEYSPPVATYIREHDSLRSIIRWGLTVIVYIIKYPLLALLLLLILLYRRKLYIAFVSSEYSSFNFGKTITTR